MSQTASLINQLGTLSYFGVFVVAIIANVLVPVPEEVVLLSFGYLAGTGRANAFILTPIIIAGLLTSDIIMYSLSKGGNKWVVKFYDKFFAGRLETKRAWIESHINHVVFFSRFLVQLRFLGPFLAGQSKISFRRFLAYEIGALVVYVPLVIWAGWYFRNRIEDIIKGVDMVRNGILILFVIILLVSFSKFMYRVTFGKQKA